MEPDADVDDPDFVDKTTMLRQLACMLLYRLVQAKHDRELAFEQKIAD